jgi:hypothetical protein
MCSSAGISGKKTNHSLRLFGVSSMFEENIPEKIIQERSGHRSITALRVYEKITNQQMTTHQQMIEISRVLMPSSSTNLGKQKSEVLGPSMVVLAPIVHFHSKSLNSLLLVCLTIWFLYLSAILSVIIIIMQSACVESEFTNRVAVIHHIFNTGGDFDPPMQYNTSTCTLL